MEGKTNDNTRVMKERRDRRSVVVAVHGARAPGMGDWVSNSQDKNCCSRLLNSSLRRSPSTLGTGLSLRLGPGPSKTDGRSTCYVLLARSAGTVRPVSVRNNTCYLPSNLITRTPAQGSQHELSKT